MRRTVLAIVAALPILVAAAPAVRAGAPGVPDPTTPAARDAEPVVLTGASFPSWAAPAEVTAKVPSLGGGQCEAANQGAPPPVRDQSQCTHNAYAQPEVATGDALGKGV